MNSFLLSYLLSLVLLYIWWKDEIILTASIASTASIFFNNITAVISPVSVLTARLSRLIPQTSSLSSSSPSLYITQFRHFQESIQGFRKEEEDRKKEWWKRLNAVECHISVWVKKEKESVLLFCCVQPAVNPHLNILILPLSTSRKPLTYIY